MSTTQENLMAAFAGESQANRKYLAFAAAADKEGMRQVAKLFRAAAAAETVHAHAHLKNAGKIGNTMANLKSAIEGETYEFTTMYPDMIKQAQAEGQSAVAKYFDFANQVEEIHAKLYKKALEIPPLCPPPIITCARFAAIPMKAPATRVLCAAAARLLSSRLKTSSACAAHGGISRIKSA